MINIRTPIIFLILLLAYSSLFIAHDKHAGTMSDNISPSLPTSVLNVLGHSYINQLIAESLFIKTAVYYGGLNQQMDEDNLEIMGQHFMTISRLHPKFLDTYYRSESVLAHRGDRFAKTANQILENGRSALPHEVALPFFEGFNYFHYLNEPVKAGKILRIASNIPHAPQWIGHLATVLAAEGGDIYGGYLWLKAMLAEEKDEYVRSRYQADIAVFKKALLVQKAIRRYHEQYGQPPKSLEDLQPEFIARLPQFEGDYILLYKMPRLSLHRKHVR